LETAKELKKPQINIDLKSLTLANLVISKRRGHQQFFDKQQKKKKAERKSWTTNRKLTKILINSKKDNRVKNESSVFPESAYTQLKSAKKKLSIINVSPSKIKVPMLDPNINYNNYENENNPNYIISNSKDANSNIFLLNNFNLTLLNVTNTFNNQVIANTEDLGTVKEISEKKDSSESKEVNHSLEIIKEVNNYDTSAIDFVVEIDELDSDDLNFINKEIKSENGGKNFKNPLRIELDKFLKINAIELEELLNDKNIVLIAEKDENKKKGRRSTYCRGIQHFLNKIEDYKEKTNDEIRENPNEEGLDSSSDEEISQNEEDEHSSRDNIEMSEFSNSSDSSRISQKNINDLSENSRIDENLKNMEVEGIKKNSLIKSSKKSIRPYEIIKLVKLKTCIEKSKNNMKRTSPDTLSTYFIQRPSRINSSVKLDEISNQSLKLLGDDKDDEVNFLEKDFFNKKNENDLIVHLKPGALELKEIKKFHKSPVLKKRRTTTEEVTSITPIDASPEKQNINKKIVHRKAEKHQHTETLEEKLTSKLANKLVVVIMAILVVLPVLDVDYIDYIRFGSDQTQSIFRYCVEGLDVTFMKTIKDLRYIKALDLIYKNCLDLTYDGSSMSEMQNEDNSTIPEPLFYNINFTEYPPYQILYKIAETDKSIMLLMPNITYQHPDFIKVLNTGRENYDYVSKFYYPDDSNSTIVLILNNYMESSLSAVLNILKVLFIAIILLYGVYLFSNDIHLNVTRHLDKIQTRVKYYLNNTDSLSENIDQDSSGSGDLRTAYEKALLLLDQKENEKKKKPKNDNETYIIDKNLKIIMNLISISLGKQSKIKI
jgi:hypothetical protein